MERVEATQLGSQYETRLMARREPAIISGLLAGGTTDSMTTLTAALARLGAIEGKLSFDDATIFRQRLGLAPPPPPEVQQRLARKVSIAEYVRDFASSPYVLFFFDDALAPFEALIAGALPEMVHFNGVYFANPGRSTHLHFDEHMASNLLYQVFGKKRCLLFPESASNLLAPFGNFSRVFIEHMTEAEKRAFVALAGGWDVVLDATETLFIPAGMWHYMEYLDPAMSFACRFGPNNHIVSLFDALGYCHPTPEFLHIAEGLVDDQHIEPAYLEAFRAIEEVAALPIADPAKRFFAVQRCVAEACAHICPDKLRLVQLVSGLEQELVWLAFSKGTQLALYQRRLQRQLEQQRPPEALETALRILTIAPDDAAALAARDRLLAETPGLVPTGTPRITLRG